MYYIIFVILFCLACENEHSEDPCGDYQDPETGLCWVVIDAFEHCPDMWSVPTSAKYDDLCDNLNGDLEEIDCSKDIAFADEVGTGTEQDYWLCWIDPSITTD